MRLNSDLRKCVAFVGYVADDEKGEPEFKPAGTGFFIHYGGVCYFVTARHVAEVVTPPFTLRATNERGEPVSVDIVGAGWFYHPDEDVDLAMVLGIPQSVPSLARDCLLTPEIAKERSVGTGDECYIVGLYRLLYGKKKNQPVVHSGNLAMLPEDEKISQRWHDGTVRYVEGYLVEAQTLEGLSGSPVFVRHVWQVPGTGDQYAMMLGDAYLLGVWSGAWDAPPGEVLSLERPGAQRVPVGMGVTVPTYKLLELLEMPKVVEHRKRRLEEEGAASQDSALPRPSVPEPPTKADNPRHREDFNQLLDGAVSGKQPRSET